MKKTIIAGGLVRDSTGSWSTSDVVLEGTLIAGTGVDPAAQGISRIDATGTVVLPGLINGHTHAHNNLLKGTGDRRWLESHINAMSVVSGWTPQDLYISTTLGIVEMLRSGTTSAYDMVRAPSEEHLAAVVQAYIDAGMRAVIGPAVSDLPFVDAVPGLKGRLSVPTPPPKPTLPSAASCLLFADTAIERWHGAGDGRVQIAIAPLIPDLCSDDLLAGCAELADARGVLLNTHLLESKHQALNGLIRGGGRPWIRHLADLSFITPSTTFAHAVWMTPEETKVVADLGATVTHNPASNLKLGSGVAPIKEYRNQGVNVALGTDGAASGDALDMFGAMWLAALISHARSPDPSQWLSAVDVFEMTTVGGARSTGLHSSLGAITPGMRADLILVSLDSLRLRPLNDLSNQLVYGYPGADVRTVLVDGRVVVDQGRVIGVDEEAVLAQADKAAERLGTVDRLAGYPAAVEEALLAIQKDLAAVPYPVDRFASR